MFLRQVDVEHVEFLELGKAGGIHGNSHMRFMELNSDVIAERLHVWISQTVNDKPSERGLISGGITCAGAVDIRCPSLTITSVEEHV